MRQSIIIFLFLLSVSSGFAQVAQRVPGLFPPMILVEESYPCSGNVVFSEDFSNGIPATWEVWDFDSLTAAPSVGLNGSWQTIADYRDTNNTAAASTSWYLPKGASDDWLVTPAMAVGNTNCLSWKAYSQDGSFKESYQVLIATAKDTASFLANSPIYSTTGEVSDPFYHNLDLSAWSGQTVYLAFRQTSDDQFVLVVDDVMLVEANSYDAGVSQMDSIDAKALGTNKIIGAVTNFALDTLESVTVTWMVEGGSPKSADLSSLGLGSGRTWSFLHDSLWVPPIVGAYAFKCWTSSPNGQADEFNDNDTLQFVTFVLEIVGIDEQPLIAGFQVYPNPAQDHAIINSETSIFTQWNLLDISGKVIKTGKLNAHDWQIDLSGIKSGLYFIQVSDKNGNTYSQKLIKK